MKEMKVSNLMLDPVSKSPIVILKDTNMKVMLPIWVGYFEATAIALELEKTAPPRPMTHDLLRNVLKETSFNVKQIVINDLKNNTFYAVIELQKDGTILKIDSRPSDAIALALRTESPIFVEEFVLEEANSINIENIDSEDKWKELLEKLKPEDFGKYKM